MCNSEVGEFNCDVLMWLTSVLLWQCCFCKSYVNQMVFFTSKLYNLIEYGRKELPLLFFVFHMDKYELDFLPLQWSALNSV